MFILFIKQVYGSSAISSRFHELSKRTILNPNFSPAPLSMIELSTPNASAFIDFVIDSPELTSDHQIGSRYNGEGLYLVSNSQNEYIFWAVKKERTLRKSHVDEIVSRVEDLLANPDKLEAEMN